MLSWVVIDRQHLRQAARFASLHSSPLFPLPHLSPLLPTPYALLSATATPQPLCNQSVTHSFYLDGGCVPLFPTCQHSNLPMFQRVSKLSPLFSHSCALFCTFLHSPKTQLFYFQAIPHSASKNTTTGRGKGYISVLQFSSKFSPVKVGNSLRSTARQSRVTSHESPSSDWGEPQST